MHAVPDPRDVPVVILCGGLGTRLRDVDERLPKPLVAIGGKPVLWHVMKTYAAFGVTRFVLALGYRSEDIKRWFLHYRENVSDFTLHMGDGSAPVFHNEVGVEDWEVTFVETGLLTAPVPGCAAAASTWATARSWPRTPTASAPSTCRRCCRRTPAPA